MIGAKGAGAARAASVGGKPRPPFRRYRLVQLGWEPIGEVYAAPLLDDPDWNRRAGFAALEEGDVK